MAPGKKTASKAQKAKKSPPAARKAPAKKAPAKTVAKAAKAAKAVVKKALPKKAAPKPAPKKAPAKKAAPPAKAPMKAAASPSKAPAKAAPAKTAPPPKPAPKPAPKAAAPKPQPAPAAPAPAPKPAPAKKAAPAPAPSPAPAPAAPAPAPAAPAKAAAKAPAKAAKKKAIPTTSLAATPVFRPYSDAAVTLAPPPPPAKPGHVDHQILSAVTYGLFAAVNKTFGFAGQSVVKNASLRMLEYGYKRGWLPPKAKEPIKALNEYFGRLETMGYAERIHITRRGEGYLLEVQGLADFDAVHSLREMHYPLLPVFLGAMLEAIIDQYFSLKVTIEPIEFQEQKRGFNIPFSIHEKPTAPEVSRLPSYSRVTDFEE